MRANSLKMAVANRIPVSTRLFISQLKKGELPSQQRLASAVNNRISPPADQSAEAVIGKIFRPKRARIVERFDAWAERSESIEFATSALHAKGLEFAWLPHRDGNKMIVAKASERVEIFSALAQAADPDDAWHLAPYSGAKTPVEHGIDLMKVKESGSLPSRLTSTGEYFLFRMKVSASGSIVTAPQFGVRISFWQEVTDPDIPRADGMTFEVGTLMAPTPNGIAAYLSPSSWKAAQESETHWPELASLPHIYQLTEPIDVVYTWVDGDDPEWKKRKNSALGNEEQSELNDTAAIDSRFVSRNELLYSLRSLEMYANWIRNIYIVTDRQIPEWLDTSNPRIHIVDHRDIFKDPDVLPVFNSHAIESQIHHIDGLSERFLYMNDDFLFGDIVQPADFFHANGIGKYFPSAACLDVAPASARDLPVLSAAKRNRELMAQEFGVTITNKFRHTPQPICKSVFEEMEEKYPELFAAVSASKFRHPDDYSIPSALYHYYAFARGKAVPGRISYGYQDIAAPELILFLNRLIRERPFKVYCLNDTDSTPEQIREQAELIGTAMEKCYPLKSSFEK